MSAISIVLLILAGSAILAYIGALLYFERKEERRLRRIQVDAEFSALLDELKRDLHHANEAQCARYYARLEGLLKRSPLNAQKRQILETMGIVQDRIIRLTLARARQTFESIFEEAFRQQGGQGYRQGAGFQPRTPSSEINAAYQTLGLQPGASWADVQSAYRKCLRSNHPDAVQARGGTQNDVDKATARMKDINAARDTLEKVLKTN